MNRLIVNVNMFMHCFAIFLIVATLSIDEANGRPLRSDLGSTKLEFGWNILESEVYICNDICEMGRKLSEKLKQMKDQFTRSGGFDSYPKMRARQRPGHIFKTQNYFK